MVHKAMLITAALALGLVSGCSGSDSAGVEQVASAGGSGNAEQSDSSGEAPAEDPEERQLQFTDCLRDHGIDISDADTHGGTRFEITKKGQVDRNDLKAAMDACRQYAPWGEEGFEMTEEQKQQMADYVDCLQAKGVEISDPDPETGMPEDAATLLRDPDDETQAAMDACEDKRPNRMMVTK